MLRAQATENYECPSLDISYVNTALLSVFSQTLHIKTPVSHAPQIPSQCQIPMALPMAETSRQGIPHQGLSTFICPFADCARAHHRRQEVARHITQHLPPSIYCLQPGCNWNGSHRDTLRSHLRTKHSGIPVPEEDEFTIYDSKVLIELLVGNVITAEQAMHVAHLEF